MKNIKSIVKWSALGVFIIALILATFYDLQISTAIANLKDGKYYTDSFFGRFFETYGESPLYIFLGISACIVALNSLRIENGKLKLLFACGFIFGSILAYAFLIQRPIKSIYKFNGNETELEEKKIIIWLIAFGVGTVLTAVSLYFVRKMSDETLSKLLLFSIIVILTFGISQGFVQGIKNIVGRQRYRTIYVLRENGLNDLVRYTKWFKINGKTEVGESLLAIGIGSDGYKSWPSGHTCASAITFTLLLLPKYIINDEKKRDKWLWIFVCIASVVTLVTAFARIYAGAHYLSDVLIGGGATVLAMIISEKIVKTLAKKIKF